MIEEKKLPNPEKAKELQEKAEQGNVDAQCELGEAYYHGYYGLEESDDKAKEWLCKAANTSDRARYLLVLHNLVETNMTSEQRSFFLRAN